MNPPGIRQCIHLRVYKVVDLSVSVREARRIVTDDLADEGKSLSKFTQSRSCQQPLTKAVVETKVLTAILGPQAGLTVV